MYLRLNKYVLSVFIALLLTFLSTSLALACTYEATITGNHVNFAITSDANSLGLIQYIRQSGTALVTQMYSQEIGEAWIYSDDPNCDTATTHPLACRQNRGAGLGDGAFWYWSLNGDGNYPNHALPAGVWGMDFNSTPTYEMLGIEYGYTHEGSIGDFWTFCTRTGDVTPSTPTPTPTPTPIPTPSFNPTPIPVTKLFFVPGMGASWNVDALINCKNSGYAGGWTLAPYAKEVYEPLLSALPSNGWNTTEFNYDWRQDVRDNANILKDTINSVTSAGEKINLVGHSMGGLIERAYLESQSGGKAAKYISAGTPHQGSAISYPAVINGEVWANNLVERIAATLLFKRCGVPPSFQNVLPIYNYLRDDKTKQLKDVTLMNTKNNYLPTGFTAPFWNVKVGTLAGTGKETLKLIDVIKDNKWPDGRPVGRENSSEGDGTVLTASSQIPGAFINDVINQSHSGLVASTEGINHILSFLGSPGIADPPYSEPNSALILVGYPGNFWLTDKNGVVTQSEQGMIAIMNPQDGNYQLQIIPTSSSTSFIVSQFLGNGQIAYKEYKFKGLTQEPKIIEFDTKHPKQNPLHEVKEYENPHFPRFWKEFWKFWHKFDK